MKHFILFMIAAICLPVSLSAQNTYSWSEKKISINSPLKLHNENYSGSFVLSGDDIQVDIDVLGGMVGVKGLAGSLESYTASFDYTSLGKAKEMNGLNNLYAAKISAEKSNRSVILCMFATTDYKQHFICEIIYSSSRSSDAETILNSISYDDENAVIVPDHNIDDNNTDDNNQTVDMIIGSTPPDFTLTDINGKKVSLSSLKGKVVLLDFWGTWCAPCIKLIPILKELYTKYQSSDFEILSIASDDNEVKWKNMVTAKGMTWTNVIDINDDVIKLYKIQAFPTLMLIDKDGKLISSAISESAVEEYLKGISNQQDDNNVINPVDESENDDYNDETPKVSNTHFNGTATEKKLWQLLADYSPDGYIILDEYYKAPSEYDGTSIFGDSDFTMWIDGNSEYDLVNSANTVVHEMNHGYTGKLYLKLLKEARKSVGGGKYSAFYLGNKRVKLVEHSNVYVTSEINNIFPKALITDRYETYVYPSEAIMGSQQDGIYGLLDELNAYYWGTKASFDFYEYYNTKYNSADGWTDFFQGFYGTYYAYLEFKTYMLVYMIYAEQNRKDVYSGIMQNNDFLYTFKNVDDNWTNLIVRFNKLKKKVIADQKIKGLEISESGGFLMLNDSGLGTFTETYNIFNDELKKEKYETIAKAMGLKTAGGPEM